jgi:hypothetical protein
MLVATLYGVLLLLKFYHLSNKSRKDGKCELTRASYLSKSAMETRRGNKTTNLGPFRYMEHHE